MFGQLVVALLFAVSIAGAYIGFALAYKSVGPVRLDIVYFAEMSLNVYLWIALILSAGSIVVRFMMFEKMGMTRTVFASELSVFMMIFLSLVIFREQLSLQDIVGGTMIIIGVFIVSWR
jgi:drug/metabolite transporter (DMT)-like permease